MSCVPWAHDNVQVDTNLAVGVGLICIAYTKDIIRRSRSLIFVNGQSACLCSFFFLLVSYQGKMCVTIHVPARAEWALYSLQYRWPTACIYKPQNCCAWQLLQLQNCQQTVFLTDNFFCRLSARYSEVYVIITALLPALQSVYRTFIICVSCGRQLNCHNHKLPAAIICSMHLEFPSQ